MGKLGDLLRTRREELGLSLAQVQEATHIQVRLLSHLEAEKYPELPPEVYLRGLLRTYAQHLGLDFHEVTELYDQSQGRKPPEPSFQEPEVRSPGRSWLSSDFFLGLALVLALLAVGWWALSRYLFIPQTGDTSAGGNIPLLAPTAVPALSSGISLTVKVEGRTLVKISLDGKLSFEGTMEAGEERQLGAQKAIGLETANAGDILVSLDGKAWHRLGERGATASWEWTRREEDILISPIS